MDVQPLSIEELIDDATDINNFASNDAQAQAVANQVNRTIGGANTVVKLLIQKIAMRQEVVTLQVLNVVEACVKNCGSRFHNEIGKYKFINELIKLLSSKYDGDITPPPVKERVVSLMFSWYVGLPHETKIAEAYKMLKQQGIIKRDPVDPSGAAGQPIPREKENTAFQDEGNTQLLKTLLSSKDAEDLHSANKLIKNMVKEEEERLDRVSKRIQVLETVANNVKLLDDMIGKYEPKTNESGLEIMNDLYERCLTLRPELFRLASKNVDDKDDSVGEILSASDELTRVIDLYKERVLFKKPSENKSEHPTPPETSDAMSNSTCLLDLDINSPVTENSDKIPNSLLDEQFKLLGLSTPINETPKQHPPSDVSGFPVVQNNWNVNPGQPGIPVQPMFTSLSSASNMLPNNNIAPMLQLRNAAMPAYNSSPFPQQQNNMVRPPPAATTTATTATTVPKKDLFDFDIFGSDFLKPSPNPEKLQSNSLDNSNFESRKAVDDSTTDQLLSLTPTANIVNQTPTIPPRNDIVNPILPVPIVPQENPSTSTTIPPFIGATPVPVAMPTAAPEPVLAPVSAPVMPEPVLAPASTPAPTPMVHVPTPMAAPVLVPLTAPVSAPVPIPVVASSSSLPAPQSANVPVPVSTAVPVPMAVHPSVPVSTPPATQQPAAPVQVSPVNYLVPLEALKTGKYPPIPVLDKDGMKTFLMLAEDTREVANPNVIVSILSTISLNTNPLSDFSIQVAVPKIMRVKLQPPTGTELSAFNPLAAPPSISQVMLIANPTKETVKLRFKIVYTLGGVSHVETANIDKLPVR